MRERRINRYYDALNRQRLQTEDLRSHETALLLGKPVSPAAAVVLKTSVGRAIEKSILLLVSPFLGLLISEKNTEREY